MLKYLLITAIAIGALAVWLDEPTYQTGTAAPAVFRYEKGRTIPLEAAGTVLLTGEGLHNGAMTVHCGSGGFAFGFNRGSAIGLNGFSAGLARQGYIALGTGERVSILSTDRDDLARIGIIDPDADPLVFNRRMDEGLKIALARCGT